MRLWGLALAAGAIVAGSVLVTPPTNASDTQLRVTQTTTTEMPAFLKNFGNLFGTGSARQSAQPRAQTTIYSRLRSRQDHTDGTSLIVQCDLQRSLVVDPATKTYYAVSFDDAARSFVAMISGIQKTFAPLMPQIHGSSTVKVTAKEQPDDKTRLIAGQKAHHVIQTVTLHITGTGDCPSGTMQVTSDEWYADNPLDAYCPLVPMQNPAALQNAVQALPMAACMGNIRAAADAKLASAKRFPLDQTTELGPLGKTHTVTSAFVVQPYDPSLFDAPAGYAQVAPPSPAPTP